MLRHYEYGLLKQPVGRVATALGVGTVTHAAFEALLMGGDWKAKAAEVLAGLSDSLPPLAPADEIFDQWKVLEVAIQNGWHTPSDWNVIAVEKEMSIPCGHHTIVGRLDSVVEWNGLVWHLQHKTMPSNRNLATYQEQQRTDWHEAVYQRMLEQTYDNVGGTLLNCIRKMAMRTVLASPTSVFQHYFLPRSSAEVDEAFLDIEQEINDIEAEMDGTRRIIKNRSHCAGQYGNSLCAFKEVCDGIVSIDDAERFETVAPRYVQGGEADV